ncbi:hypothetical protein Cgig2_027489 [Carnegiea gigantea]|uniref:Uncharacterized protein n=1 Tax=Carnegiea gigantea TaxID=171969 RepID=A0A9Q1KNL4_9CARY|nr:hypothetical protein Cgig2_027489 [Carnegiea gigantea]
MDYFNQVEYYTDKLRGSETIKNWQEFMHWKTGHIVQQIRNNYMTTHISSTFQSFIRIIAPFYSKPRRANLTEWKHGPCSVVRFRKASNSHGKHNIKDPLCTNSFTNSKIASNFVRSGAYTKSKNDSRCGTNFAKISTLPLSQNCTSVEHIHSNIQELHIYWKQRSKLRWDILGDNMTKFFFNYAKERASRNCIRGCQAEDGRWIDDQDELTCYAVNYFQQLYCPPQPINESNTGQTLSHVVSRCRKQLTQDDTEWLSQPSTKEEVRSTIFDMNGWK